MGMIVTSHGTPSQPFNCDQFMVHALISLTLACMLSRHQPVSSVLAFNGIRIRAPCQLAGTLKLSMCQ